MKPSLFKLYFLLVLSSAVFSSSAMASAKVHKCYVVGADKNYYIVLSETKSLKQAWEITKRLSIELRRHEYVKVKKIVECADEGTSFSSPAANKLDKETAR